MIPRPPREAERLAELQALGVLDTPREAVFDALTRLAAFVCGTPISLVTLIDEERQWFKAEHGLDLKETNRDIAFCAYTVMGDDLFIVPDALEDSRFIDNPLVNDDPRIRFYAGIPLRTPSGHSLGSLCVLDRQPRLLTSEQRDALSALAKAAFAALDARRRVESLRDVSVQLQSKKRIREQDLDQLFDRTTIGMAITDLDGEIQRVNRAFGSFLGRGEDELRGVNFADLVHRDERADVLVNLGRLVACQIPSLRVERRFRGPRDATVWGTQVVHPLHHDDGRLRALLIEVSDETPTRSVVEELVHAELHDTITGLPNRVLLADRLDQALAVARRSGSTVGVILLDIDNFSLVNDTRGHAAGDAMLVDIAERMAGILPVGATTGRLGGDTFAVIHPAVGSAGSLDQLARRLVSVGEPSVTLSAGVAASSPLSTAVTLLRDADAALFQAKLAGRSAVEVFDFRLRERLLRRATIEDGLRRAIARDELDLVYQPQFSLQTGEMIGLEALLRWHHPDEGLLLPGDFLPTARDAGLMQEVGAWVLRRAVADAARFGSRWAEVPTVWVNLSPEEVCAGLAERIASILHDSDLVPARFGIEITEDAGLSDEPEVAAELAALRDLGVRIAVDDFGTGYSALAYLSRLPFDTLKLDRAIVSTVSSGGAGSALIAAALAMASALGLHVVAEGVETAEQREQLLLLGCEAGQGFLLGMPAPQPIDPGD